MTEIILIRHCETTKEKERHPKLWGLSEAGTANARELAGLLAGRIGALLSSEEPKASATASAMGDALRLTPRMVAGLEEQHQRLHVWHEAEAFDRLVGDALDRPDERLLGDETATEAALRFESALGVIRDLLAERAAIVTHGRVMTAFIARHNRVLASAFWKRLEMPAYVVLRAADYRLIEVNFDPCRVGE
jgi:broad specificity phosphatase PhoE